MRNLLSRKRNLNSSENCWIDTKKINKRHENNTNNIYGCFVSCGVIVMLIIQLSAHFKFISEQRRYLFHQITNVRNLSIFVTALNVCKPQSYCYHLFQFINRDHIKCISLFLMKNAWVFAVSLIYQWIVSELVSKQILTMKVKIHIWSK